MYNIAALHRANYSLKIQLFSPYFSASANSSFRSLVFVMNSIEMNIRIRHFVWFNFYE